jgi:transcriptional regulator with GAF, ATPase, and Fis domain
MSVPPDKKPVSMVPTNGSGSIRCWLHYWEQTARPDKEALTRELTRYQVNSEPLNQNSPSGAGVCVFSEPTPELRDFLWTVSRAGRERIIAVAGVGGLVNGICHWDLLQAGASDVLVCSDPDRVARQVRTRFERWLSVDQLIETPSVADFVVGKSAVWRAILRGIVEIARFSDASALILGESGTGKEIVARLFHLLDPRPTKRDLVVLDCSTVVPGLSGSEFFGHERGAFTGAVSERDGAFTLANGGTLFLDEIGELPLPLQAQLLRVVQERTYKRLGGNTWRRTDFRLVCATNRDLVELIRRGEFRADLYYRIASFVCKLPALRERLEDIMPLAKHFLREIHPNGEPPEFDAAVRDYLLQREYPGNVRDLRQVVSRLMYRYVGDGTITVGNIPPEERPLPGSEDLAWLDLQFERVIQRAVLLGAGLKAIGRAAEDVAIRIATHEEDGNLSRAARRLGVTDRALQLRRANRRQADEIQPMNLCVEH